MNDLVDVESVLAYKKLIQECVDKLYDLNGQSIQIKQKIVCPFKKYKLKNLNEQMKSCLKSIEEYTKIYCTISGL
jgi:hypothetical protein